MEVLLVKICKEMWAMTCSLYRCIIEGICTNSSPLQCLFAQAIRLSTDGMVRVLSLREKAAFP